MAVKLAAVISEDGLSNYLAKTSLKLSTVGAAGIAQVLSAASREAAFHRGTDIPSSLSESNRSCGFCGCIFVPGETMKARIKPVRGRRRRLRVENAGTARKNYLSLTCLLCSKETRLDGSEPRKRKQHAPDKSKATFPQKGSSAPSVPLSSSNTEFGFISLSQTKKRPRKSKLPAVAVISNPQKSPFQKFLSSV